MSDAGRGTRPLVIRTDVARHTTARRSSEVSRAKADDSTGPAWNDLTRRLCRATMGNVHKAVVVAAVVLSLFGGVAASPVAEAGEVEEDPATPFQSLNFVVDTKVIGEQSPGTVVQGGCPPPAPVLPQPARLGFAARGGATGAGGDPQGGETLPENSTWFFLSSNSPATQATCTFTE